LRDAPRGADRLLRDNGVVDGLRLADGATRLVGGSLRTDVTATAYWLLSARAPRGAVAGKREKNRTGPLACWGFARGSGPAERYW